MEYLSLFPFLYICGKFTHFSYEKRDIPHIFDIYHPLGERLTNLLTTVIFVKPNEQIQACLSYAMARNGRIDSKACLHITV